MTRYLGGLITKDESLVIPSDNYETTSAPGVWTLEEAQALNKQGLWPTAGVSDPDKFVENIFSCNTYTGTGSDLTVTTGIDTLNDGGLIWLKRRDSNVSHGLFDTVRGTNQQLLSDTTGVNENGTPSNNRMKAFLNNGFQVGDGDFGGNNNEVIAWTFKKTPGFFDLVGYAGNDTAGRTVSHNLGVAPELMIIKNRDAATSWRVYVSALGEGKSLNLNDNSAQSGNVYYLNNTAPTSTLITLGQDDSTNGGPSTAYNYVAYLFASVPGISKIGTFDLAGDSAASVNLGFEPQFILMKDYESSSSWYIFDTLRGMNHDFRENLYPNLNNAADITTTDATIFPTATGFEITTSFGNNKYIYMAIAKAPMQTPTSRASVFEVAYQSGSSSGKPNFKTTTFPVDLSLRTDDLSGGAGTFVQDRLRGTKAGLRTHGTDSESFNNSAEEMDFTNGYNTDSGSGTNVIAHMWRRAPGYFDIVPYTGNGSDGRTINHSLGVVPDMIWFKIRESASAAINYARGWVVTSRHLPNATSTNDTTLYLNTNAAEVDEAIMYDVAPTSTVFSVSSDPHVNFLNTTYVAYLFANLTGISKIGTFSHTNGSSTDVDCGFSSGSRWVLVKRTDSTGSWYVWDSQRGIGSGNDPYILLDSSAAQETNQDYIDPLNSGFQIASGFTTGSYFFYAIAA